MTSRRVIGYTTACATLVAVALVAQENPPGAQPGEIDLKGIPAPRGIYYRTAGEWISLPHTILMPFAEGKNAALEVLNVGRNHTVVEIPGAHAVVQIGNEARPTFYLHGISPADVYLIRARSKAEYREVRMPISIHFREWAHFDAKDIADFGIAGVNGDVVAIQPVADLKPGEYALAAVIQPGDYWLRMGFDFGVAGRVTQ